MLLAKNKILYVIGSLERGGAELHLLEVATRLKARGWDIELYVLEKGGVLTSQFEEEGIIIHGIEVPTFINRLLVNDRLRAWCGLGLNGVGLIWTLWSRRPAIVHYFLPAAYIIGGLASLFAPFSTRIMSRRSLNHYQRKNKLFARVERFLHPRMDAICGNSKAVLENLKEEGVDLQRLRLIYNGKKVEYGRKLADRGIARAELGLSKDALLFVIVANLIPYKGHSDLISALGLIKHTLPKQWQLLCLGRDDGILAELQSLAEQAGISSNVRLMGACSEVSRFLEVADVGILSSHEEGFSNALLEYMVAGLPIVATDVGGNSEAVQDGVTGYICPARNPEKLAQAIARVVSNSERVKMGWLGRKRLEEFFSIKACIANYEHLYIELLEVKEKRLVWLVTDRFYWRKIFQLMKDPLKRKTKPVDK